VLVAASVASPGCEGPAFCRRQNTLCPGGAPRGPEQEARPLAGYLFIDQDIAKILNLLLYGIETRRLGDIAYASGDSGADDTTRLNRAPGPTRTQLFERVDNRFLPGVEM